MLLAQVLLLLIPFVIAQHDFSHMGRYRKLREGSAVWRAPETELSKEKIAHNFGRFGHNVEHAERARKAMRRRHGHHGKRVKGGHEEGKHPHGHQKRVDEIAALHENAETDRPSIHEINANLLPYLYNGDIVLSSHQINEIEAATPEEGETSATPSATAKPQDGKQVAATDKPAASRRRRGAPIITLNLWDVNKEISFMFGKNMTDIKTQDLIRKTLGNIQSATCLKFREYTGTANLEYFKGDGCYSSLGRLKNRTSQGISIGVGCEIPGIIAHETLHAIGLDHTQTRKDRDVHVSVNAAVIKDSYIGNFQKNSDKDNDNFGTSYDYGSVLHYGAFDFSNSAKPSLVPLETGFADTMGQRLRVQFNDFKMVNSLYKCAEHAKCTIKCQNGGYPNPKNCNKCVCSDFYDGDKCEKLKFTVAVTRARNISFTSEFDAAANKAGNNYNFDKFLVALPTVVEVAAGKRVNATFLKMYAGFGQLPCYAKCPFTAIELVDGSDLSRAGQKFCCGNEVGRSVIFPTNRIGFKAYASPGMPFEATVSFSAAN